MTLKIEPILVDTVSLWSEQITSVIEQVKAILLTSTPLYTKDNLDIKYTKEINRIEGR